MTRYFSYGANMDPTQMAERCPGATRIGTAVLSGHGFRIGAGGYGTAVATAGYVIHGVLWDLTPADEAALDRFEGLAEGFYRKEVATVRTEAGRDEPAMLYRAADPAPGSPVPGYLERIIEVADQLGFPIAYVAQLRRLLIAPVPPSPAH